MIETVKALPITAIGQYSEHLRVLLRAYWTPERWDGLNENHQAFEFSNAPAAMRADALLLTLP